VLRVLVVDDSEGTRATYRAALRAEGYDVGLASSRETAVQFLSTEDIPHAMFLDLNLGDGTGFDVLRWMRAERRFVPTVVMTAFRLEFGPDEAIELGAAAYVDQPLSVEGLIALAGSLTRPMSTLDDPNQLHVRVCAGDPGALEFLGAVFLRDLPRRLARAFPRVSADVIEDAVSTACVEYLGGAASGFDTAKGRSVLDFVYTIAWRNLRDRLQSESSRADRERRWVQEQPHSANPPFDIPVATFDVWSAIMAVTKDPAERRAAAVWLDGGNSHKIAAALGFGHSDPPDRCRASKQFKDRLIRRLSRYVRK
jgi:CheY-like chemotaxis protein